MEHPPDYLLKKREPIISVTDRLRGCYTGAVYDVLRAKGHTSQTLPAYIRPLNIQQVVVGPVFTIEGKRDDSLTEHQSLLKWCELLSNAPANTVLVSAERSRSGAYGRIIREDSCLQEGTGIHRGWRMPRFGFHREDWVSSILQILCSGRHRMKMGSNRIWRAG
jgi:hypothetical protein